MFLLRQHFENRCLRVSLASCILLFFINACKIIPCVVCFQVHGHLSNFLLRREDESRDNPNLFMLATIINYL